MINVSLASEEVNALMDTIIFNTKSGNYVSKADAKLTKRKITTFETTA